MAILSRFIRLCKADIHGVMDQMEDKTLLLKQHLREMEMAINQNESRLRGLSATKKEIQSVRDNYLAEIEKCEADLRMAITKDRDDIARMLIRKTGPLKVHLENLDKEMAILEAEGEQIGETLGTQRVIYEKIRVRSLSFMHHAKHERSENGALVKGVSILTEDEPSAEEVELELMRQKDLISGGVGK